ncbi:hypothetical protein HYR99_40750 [Candidatus Poribacteria bacterium]|nr:hypothetical protein [Candidatus Poribacteria bacterium]
MVREGEGRIRSLHHWQAFRSIVNVHDASERLKAESLQRLFFVGIHQLKPPPIRVAEVHPLQATAHPLRAVLYPISTQKVKPFFPPLEICK